MSTGNLHLDLRPSEKEIVKNILRRYIPGVEVRVFGSRAIGKAKKYSDLDLLLVSHGKVPLSTLAQLQEAFEESDLSFKVDIVDMARLAPEFREILRRESHYIIVSP